MEKMDQLSADCNHAPMDHTLNDLKTYVERAAQEGTAAHEVEAAIWSRVLQLGKQALDVVCPGGARRRGGFCRVARRRRGPAAGGKAPARVSVGLWAI